MQRLIVPFPYTVICPEVNHGRWIIPCPLCKGALRGLDELGRRRSHFTCADCRNEGGPAVKVQWPPEQVIKDVERLLGRRPNPANRNWRVNEPVDNLVLENAAHGVPT
jgi:hypothetical protein